MTKNKIRSAASILSAALLAAPALVFGTTVVPTTQTRDLSSLIDNIIGYLNKALVLFMAVAVVMFVFYVIKYFIKPNEDRTGAAQYIMYSIIGFFVILSVWGLVNILTGTFGLDNTTPSWSGIQGLFPSGGGTGGSGSVTNVFNSSGSGSVTNAGGSGSVTNAGGSGSVTNTGGSGSVTNDPNVGTPYNWDSSNVNAPDYTSGN